LIQGFKGGTEMIGANARAIRAHDDHTLYAVAECLPDRGFHSPAEIPGSLWGKQQVRPKPRFHLLSAATAVSHLNRYRISPAEFPDSLECVLRHLPV
jgi:hypothetical protein